MPLPDSIAQLLWSGLDNTLCGVALGDSFGGLQLPKWWSDSHSEGKTRYGWLAVEGGGVDRTCCSVTEVLGRVSRIEVSLEIDDQAAEQAIVQELGALLDTRLGARTGKSKKSVRWAVDGALAGELELRVASFSMDGDDIWRVELDLLLADGVEITADARSLFVDVNALADVLATAAFPAERCVEIFTRYFARERQWMADAADKADFTALLQAARAERPEQLRSMVERVCLLGDFSDLVYGDSVRGSYLLKGLLHYGSNGSSIKTAPNGLLHTNVADVLRFLEILEIPSDERPAWAVTLIAALEYDDVDARAAVCARMVGKKLDPYKWLVWDTTEEVEARAFALLTSSLPSDEARILAAAGVSCFGSSVARACTAHFVATQGLPRPDVAAGNDVRLHDFVEFLTFVRASFPAVYDDVVGALLDRIQQDRLALGFVLDAMADDKTAGPTRTWRLGQHTVTHSGKPNAGRWKITRDDPTAKKATATKKAAASGDEPAPKKRVAKKKATPA